MTELRIYLYRRCGTLSKFMADLKGFTTFDEFVAAVERRMKLYHSAFNDKAQYLIVSHKTTTLSDSRILAHAKWDGKNKKLAVTKV